jgi:hydrogenase-4 component E
MSSLPEIILILFLLSSIILASSSRLIHCVQLVSVQGVLLGIVPLVFWDWQSPTPYGELLFVSLLNIIVKGIILPLLLILAMHRANVRRELEPLVSYTFSQLIAIAIIAGCFAGYRLLNESAVDSASLAIPVAAATMLIGLFIIMARRKAITQVIGFLVFENGIAVFASGLMVHHGILVELGILLDVFALVFIMGIAVFKISREFQHIDADRLNVLRDRRESDHDMPILDLSGD